MNHWDDLTGQVMIEAFSVQFDLLFGRRTYERAGELVTGSFALGQPSEE